MVKQCSLMSISNFLALAMWLGRSQGQKESCRSLTMIVREKGWGWDKYVTLHKEQHAIMDSLRDYGYSGMDNGIKVNHFVQGNKSPELEAVVNVVCAQPEKYGTVIWAKWS